MNRKSFYQKLKYIWILTGVAAAVILVINFIRLNKVDAEHKAADALAAGQEVKQDAEPELPGDTSDPTVSSALTEGDASKEGSDLGEAGDASKEGSDMDGTGDASKEGTDPDETGDANKEDSAEKSLDDVALPGQERILDPNKPMVAFSFDDGPSETATRRILEVLKRHNVKATFFMVGDNIDRLPDIVKEVYDAGQEIGNHTDKHSNLLEVDDEHFKREVQGNLEKLKKLVDVDEVLVRPPYGNYNDHVKALVGAPMILWSVDSEDWKSKDCDTVVNEIMNDVQDGYIVLMHDLYSSTADAVEVVVPKLIDAGYQIVSVTELFESRGEELKDGHVYRMCTPAPTPEAEP